jgi:hypothetical protein
MKKLFYLVLLICLPAFFYCQDIPKDAAKEKPKRALYKGRSSVNLYYGTNLLSGFLKNVFTQSNSLGVTVQNLGPIGLTYEYMVTDEVGIGVEGGYSSTKITFYEEDFDYNGQMYTYDYSYNITLARAMFRFNYHFTEDEKFDAYMLVSGGYRYREYSLSTNDPILPKITWTGIPFGVKPGIGLRYFFVKNVGLNLEFAAGTPLICGGLSFKF